MINSSGYYTVLYDDGDRVAGTYMDILSGLMPSVAEDPSLLGKRVRKYFKSHKADFEGTISAYE